ncbi:hypothetical protein [Seohaeicola zhoushanensis]|uniref:Lipoprotein n=1 Tax=Seohaeicola zhoushanensis TaxID=1569283 RepID=A0A8J3H3V1_9RHOB|nr:hypothetical protein [Seohaeicola zhoushanensis]GHF74673.1 hypothetical protein GCM10017056_51630 [Seohaeicola zhoushanensis]
MLRSAYLIRASLVLALAGGLAACGDDPLEQGLYGGALGMGTAAILDGNLVAGAAVGAGANLLYCQKNPGRC